MVLYSKLPVYRDSYMLLTEIYRATNSFPKDYKYSLGQDMKRDVLSLFRHLYNANCSMNNKREYLELFLKDFELLKIELRLCVDLNILSIRKLAQLSLITDSISKQVISWRNKAA